MLAIKTATEHIEKACQFEPNNMTYQQTREAIKSNMVIEVHIRYSQTIFTIGFVCHIILMQLFSFPWWRTILATFTMFFVKGGI